jgi:SAM-dependent methyltransferase
MASWDGGYVQDVPYVPGFYPEQSLEYIRFAQLLGGVRPAGLGERASYLELGFGLGHTLNVLAAAHPEVDFWGIDFNPTHVVLAKELASDVLSNLTLLDASFDEFAVLDTPQFDFIALHGIWTWVSVDNQRTIVQLLKSKLKPGGAVYISYNTLPGWAILSPLRELLAQHATYASPSGDSSSVKAQRALAFVGELEKNQVQFITGNRALMERLAQVRQSPIEYVTHEYMNGQHLPRYFSEVSEALEEAKLTFVGSSRVLSTLDGVNLTPAGIQHLASIANPTLRQVVRDFYTATMFRQDVFVRGRLGLSPIERSAALDAVRLHLLSSPAEVPRKINGPLGEISMQEAIYDPVLERLAAAGGKGLLLGDLRTVGQLKSLPPEAAVEAACMLIAAGSVYPVVDTRPHADPTIAKKLAVKMLQRCEAAGSPQFMPSPVTRNGHGFDRITASFILGYMEGVRDKQGLTRRAWKALERAGQRVVKDGKPLATEQENIADLEPKAAKFLAEGCSALERVGLL